MAYNITEGWYKLIYEVSVDKGVTYPYEYSVLAPLFISDTDFSNSALVSSDTGEITERGTIFLAESNVYGLVNAFTMGFYSELPKRDLDDINNTVINRFGVINVSLSLPTKENLIPYNDIYYKVYLNDKNTLLYAANVYFPGYWTPPERELFAYCYSFYAYGDRYELAIPSFQANTELTAIKVGRLEGYYSSGNCSVSVDLSTSLSKNLIEKFDGIEPYVEDTDPYSKGGDTETGGGTGDFDGTSDDIPIPELPTLSATSTNFITLFNPSLGELQNLANYMWSDLFDLDTFKKIFADPMDCILGLSIVPVAVPSGGSKAVTVGNISTGVTMQVASAQYVSVDCGTLNVNEYWGAYLDYDPYTKAEIYLPYIGTHPIAVDDIMGKAVHVVYHVDILSGACTAYVQCGGSVLYSFIGQCSASIPITGNDWTNVINGVLSIAGSIGSMVATGGMSAPLTALQAPVTAAKVGSAMATGSSLASTAVNSLKPSVEKSGSMSGVGGMLAVQTPYIILTRPRQARPKQQNTYTGYPSFITSKLSKLTGYTEIEVIHLDGLSCTDSEAVEIESLLKSGVIF